MSINIHRNIVSQDEVNVLLDYLESGQGIFDQRPDVTTRRPTHLGVPYDKSTWPMELAMDIIDRVVDSDKPWEIEPGSALFYDAKDCFGLHVDSGDGDQKTLHKNILIPLYTEDSGSTVLFENKWYGPRTRFARVYTNPFSYRLPKKDGKFHVVDDIRNLTDLSEFNITEEQLQDLIVKRSDSYTKPPEPRLTDYSQIEGYDPNLEFDKEFHQRWLSHVPIENLHGLTVKEVVQWNVGDVIVWDRQYIHSSSSDHRRKKGLTMFTNLVYSQQT